jgi:hypothetical protein
MPQKPDLCQNRKNKRLYRTAVLATFRGRQAGNPASWQASKPATKPASRQAGKPASQQAGSPPTLKRMLKNKEYL